MSARIKSLLILILFISTAFVEINPLDQKITLGFENESIESALIQLAETSNSKFAFNPDLLPQKRVNGKFEETSLAEILIEILGSEYEYKTRGNYIIILEAPQPKQKKARETFQIQGKILDASSGEELSNTTVYEVGNLDATLTNDHGDYTLEPDQDQDVVLLAISKENYKDTVIAVEKSQNAFLQLMLEPIEKTEQVIEDIGEFTKIFINEKLRNHDKNVEIEEKRIAQASLVPGVSTNGSLSGHITNNLSFNALGGYARGLNGLEVGGLFNVERDIMKGVQVAGLFNNVGGMASGVQISGGANVVKRYFNGIQVSGGANVAKDVQGIQAAGGANVTRRLNGLQAAGAYNQARLVSGLQVSGVINTTRYLYGAQFSGFVNYSREAYGAQFSGIMNKAQGDMSGIQVSGIRNCTDGKMSGVQIGLFNHAGNFDGVQIGLINNASQVESGTMIGLINLAKGEIVALDFDYNDVTEYNVSFKSGVKHFYTIFAAGLSQGKDLWSGGFGLGTQKDLHRNFYIGLEATGHPLFPLYGSIESLPIDARLNLNFGIQASRRISLHGGPVFHFLHHENSEGLEFTPETLIGTDPLNERTFRGANQKWWIGYRLGIRI
ncbi:MAG: hypothetical protein JXR10_08155 [Cyclobacteriaceae bacterium]